MTEKPDKQRDTMLDRRIERYKRRKKLRRTNEAITNLDLSQETLIAIILEEIESCLLK